MIEIPLTKGYKAKIDDFDCSKVMFLEWSVHPDKWNFYATTKIKSKVILMHRFILEVSSEIQVDHKDGNGLNNQRENLRIATVSQNNCNKEKYEGVSKYKGVTWCNIKQKWRARIQIGRKKIHIGYFQYEIEAALAYDDAAKKHHGEFAQFNF